LKEITATILEDMANLAKYQLYHGQCHYPNILQQQKYRRVDIIQQTLLTSDFLKHHQLFLELKRSLELKQQQQFLNFFLLFTLQF
jgi:hypothetical protein